MGYVYKESYWETKDHKILKISTMEDSHIENTIKFLEKRPYFYDEGGSLGYCDDDDFESYYYEDNSHLVDKKIKEFKEELEKRAFYDRRYEKRNS